MLQRGLIVVVALVESSCAGLLFLEQAQPCAQHADCPQGLVCAGGYCIKPPPGDCSPANPAGGCPAGEVCENGACMTDIRFCCDCADTQGCQDCVCMDCTPANQCAPIVRETGCCSSGNVCVGGYCQPAECGTLGSGCCESGLTCEGGRCVLISENPCAGAPGTGRCPAGQICLDNGVCAAASCSLVYPCGSCPLSDHVCRSGVCEQLPCSPEHPQGLCANSSEKCSSTGACIPNSACLADADCSNGFCSFCGGNPGACRSTSSCACEGDCPAANDFCSNFTPRRCIADGTCAGNLDCTIGLNCCSTDRCIEPGKCCSANDCPPGNDCNASGDCIPTGTPCTTNVTVPNTGQCAPDQLYCCDSPNPQDCCRPGERCSSSGFCVPLGGCANNGDCLQPQLTCQSGVCQGSGCTGACPGGCQGSCAAGEICSADGACIPDDRCAASADCNDGEFCTGEYACQVYCGCGCTPYESQLVPPNMLIVLDRSGSMNSCVVCTNGPACTRWNIARGSLSTMMINNSGNIRFGLSTYPYYCPGSTVCGTTTGNDCGSASCNNNCDWNVRCDDPCSPFNNNQSACQRFASTCEWVAASSTCRWLGGGTATQAACGAFPPCRWNTGAFNGTNRCDPDDAAIATGGNVMPGDVDVTVGDNTIATINASLNPPSGTVGAQHPGGNTPTGRTLRTIAANLAAFGLTDTTRGNYILLVTDGDANGDGGTYGVCDGALTGVRDLDNSGGGITGADTTYARVNCALSALRAANPPVTTYVVGFAGGSSDILNCHAVYGGASKCATPPQCAAITDQTQCTNSTGCAWNAGACGGGVDTTNCELTAAECFYRANDAVALSDAFANIAGQIASCTYSVIPPPNWSKVFVYLDYGTNTPPSACSGNPCRVNPSGTTWTNSGTDTLQFHEPMCSDTLRSGLASPIIVVGCPDPPG